MFSERLPKDFSNYIKALPQEHALSRQFLVSEQEKISGGLIDPIGDSAKRSGEGLIHRYKNKILVTPTSSCPVHCRYCFRRNLLESESADYRANKQMILDYLKEHSDVSEVILTGGDPLSLSMDELFSWVNLFAGQVPFLRLHTRGLVACPQKFSSKWIENWLAAEKGFKRLHLVAHINHVSELNWSPKVRRAIEELATKTRSPLLTQSVLLRGVNDDLESLVELFEELVKLGTTPYYLHHPDNVRGAQHFYVNLARGREIYSGLQTRLPGWAIPKYVIDIPGGHGKVMATNCESGSFSGQIRDAQGHFHHMELDEAPSGQLH